MVSYILPPYMPHNLPMQSQYRESNIAGGPSAPSSFLLGPLSSLSRSGSPSFSAMSAVSEAIGPGLSDESNTHRSWSPTSLGSFGASFNRQRLSSAVHITVKFP